MKRLSVILTILMAMFLTACASNPGTKWGSLDVSVTNQKVDANGWQATVVVKNSTKQSVPLQYNGPVKHTLTITRDGKEIYKQVFNPIKEPLLHTLTPDTYQEHLVIWRFVDQEGKKVSPGAYQARIEINAVTVGATGGPAVPTISVNVK